MMEPYVNLDDYSMAVDEPMPMSPERDLMAAVLHDAIHRRDAAWVAGRDAPLTFAAVCDLLNLDADIVRACIVRGWT